MYKQFLLTDSFSLAISLGSCHFFVHAISLFRIMSMIMSIYSKLRNTTGFTIISYHFAFLTACFSVYTDIPCRRCTFLKPECVNISNKSYFVIQPKCFYQLSADPKNDNLESESNGQQDQWTMSILPPFLLSFFTDIGRCHPLPQPSSSSLTYMCHKLYLRWQQSSLEIFIMKRILFTFLFWSWGDSGSERQQEISCQPWWVAYI